MFCTTSAICSERSLTSTCSEETKIEWPQTKEMNCFCHKQESTAIDLIPKQAINYTSTCILLKKSSGMCDSQNADTRYADWESIWKAWHILTGAYKMSPGDDPLFKVKRQNTTPRRRKWRRCRQLERGACRRQARPNSLSQWDRWSVSCQICLLWRTRHRCPHILLHFPVSQIV